MRAEDDVVFSQEELTRAEAHVDACRTYRNRAVVRLKEQGWSLQKIATLIGVSDVAVHYILTRYREASVV